MTKIEQLRAIPLAITPIDVLRLLDLVEIQHEALELADFRLESELVTKALAAFENWNKQ